MSDIKNTTEKVKELETIVERTKDKDVSEFSKKERTEYSAKLQELLLLELKKLSKSLNRVIESIQNDQQR